MPTCQSPREKVSVSLEKKNEMQPRRSAVSIYDIISAVSTVTGATFALVAAEITAPAWMGAAAVAATIAATAKVVDSVVDSREEDANKTSKKHDSFSP